MVIIIIILYLYIVVRYSHVIIWNLSLHGLQQLHVLLISSSTFHLVVQLQNDLILKLQESENRTQKVMK